ncbi:hypothetical protein N4G69_18925 [Streptomyces mirabilis]|uniref:hypothetical protein n=1 Tax=Streptomyces mirabilis TaxID=68239 RepID=UPI0021BE3082|nr:hypothetical protein [Streptomyces mirabilis]MCT9107685.1 hypothetical protein [Streptomyces mirabilis]
MTEKLLGPLRTRPWPERWLTRVLGAALSGAAYLLCLPWDLRNRPGVTGSVTETTSVTVLGAVLLGVALLFLAAYLGRRDALAWPLLLVAGPPAALMYLSFHSHPEPPDAAVWPLTWAFFTLVVAAGVLIATAVARRYRAADWASSSGSGDSGDSWDSSDEALSLARWW